MLIQYQINARLEPWREADPWSRQVASGHSCQNGGACGCKGACGGAGKGGGASAAGASAVSAIEIPRSAAEVRAEALAEIRGRHSFVSLMSSSGGHGAESWTRDILPRNAGRSGSEFDAETGVSTADPGTPTCKELVPIWPSTVVQAPCKDRCPCPGAQGCYDQVPGHVQSNYFTSDTTPATQGDATADCKALAGSPMGRSVCSRKGRAGGGCPAPESSKSWAIPGCGCLIKGLQWANGATPPLCPATMNEKLPEGMKSCCDPCPGGLPLFDGSCTHPSARHKGCGLVAAWKDVSPAYGQSVAFGLAQGYLSDSDLPFSAGSCDTEACADKAKWQCFCPGKLPSNPFLPLASSYPPCAKNCAQVLRAESCA